MKTINKEDFTMSFFALLEETFEKVPEDTGGFFLNKNDNLFATIAELSAEQANVSVGDNAASIAAHVNHLRFYMTILKRFISEDSANIVDWNDSWVLKPLSEKEWGALKEAIKAEYDELKNNLLGFEEWTGKKLGGAMAIVTHSAYHLGAIRQITKTVFNKGISVGGEH